MDLGAHVTVHINSDHQIQKNHYFSIFEGFSDYEIDGTGLKLHRPACYQTNSGPL